MVNYVAFMYVQMIFYYQLIPNTQWEHTLFFVNPAVMAFYLHEFHPACHSLKDCAYFTKSKRLAYHVHDATMCECLGKKKKKFPPPLSADVFDSQRRRLAFWPFAVIKSSSVYLTRVHAEAHGRTNFPL